MKKKCTRKSPVENNNVRDITHVLSMENIKSNEHTPKTGIALAHHTLKKKRVQDQR